MIKQAFAFGALVAVSSGCGVLGAVGNGKVVEATRTLPAFTQVVSRGFFDVTVDQNSDPSTNFRVQVTTDSNLQSVVDTHVEGDTLILDETYPGTFHATQMSIAISLPDFHQGALEGAGRFAVTGVNQTQDAELTLSGSGEMTFQGSARQLTARLGGSGTFTLGGDASSLNAGVSGSGRLDAENLQANDAVLNLSGSGQLLGTALQTVSLDLSGAGAIDWWGPATITSVNQSGAGHIAHH